MSKKQEDLVLVGFGKHDLCDMLKWIGTEKETDLVEAVNPKTKGWPPVYRRVDLCSEKEKVAFFLYYEWLTALVREWDKENNKDV